MKRTKSIITKDKTSNHSTKSQLAPKRTFDEYINIFTMQPVIVHDEWMAKFCGDMIKEIYENKEIIQTTEYFRSKGIDSDSIARWSEKYPVFKKAYKEILLMIGDRRESYGLWNKMNAGMVSYTMAHYSPKWRSLAEWRAALKKESEGQQGQNITVVMEAYKKLEDKP